MILERTTKNIRKEAWKWFSRYIRFVRDQGVCYTCGKVQDPKEMDTGHYKHSAYLDFSEINCHCQCVSCNRDLYGNPKVYRRKLVEEYGEGAIQMIEFMAKRIDVADEKLYYAVINIYKELCRVDNNATSVIIG